MFDINQVNVVTIMDALPFYVIIIDEDHTILHANKAVEDILGLPLNEIVGQFCPKIMHNTEEPFPGCPLEISLASGEIAEVEIFDDIHERWFNSVIYPLESNGNKRLFVHMVHDITDKKNLEFEIVKQSEALARTEKLEALTNMARSITHDVNNLLTTIFGYSDILLSQMKDTRQIEDISTIVEASKRVSMLSKQLGAFAREQSMEFKPVGVNEIIAGLERYLRALPTETVDIVMDLNENIPPVSADPVQIEQVIINLVGNACDASPDGGVITIKTDVKEFPKSLHPFIHSNVTNRLVQISVSDTGVGMDEETQKRIFEPFFSTKANKGNGLGLPTVYGIIKQHDGSIEVESTLGHGSTFSIYLSAL